MIKLLELAVKTAENVAKALASVTETAATKASVATIEESAKVDTKKLTSQVSHHKAVKEQLNKLFD